jgi:hypothetical protein
MGSGLSRPLTERRVKFSSARVPLSQAAAPDAPAPHSRTPPGGVPPPSLFPVYRTCSRHPNPDGFCHLRTN